jgi:TetR/AcrR family transcriptional regulator, cholesterol catabolism regulator
MSEVPFSNADQATLKSEETRRQIVDAAAHLLNVRGISGTRLVDVVEYTQMQPAVTYYHFESFRKLVEEVLYTGITEMRSHLEKALEALPPDTSPVDRLMVAVETHMRRELELSDYGRAWTLNYAHIPGGMTRRLKTEEAAYGRIWRNLFNDAIAGGKIAPGVDVRMARRLMLGAMNSATEWWDPRRGSLDTLVTTTQLLIRSCLPSTT